MLKKSGFLKIGISCLAFFGVVYSTPLTLSQGFTSSYDKSWQDIKSVTASFVDGNNNSILEIGENVTFSVVMHKTYWGVHDFDALKIWVDESDGANLMSDTGTWDFDKYVNNSKHSDFDYKPWKGGNKLFTFDYTFNTAGTYDFVAAVMCSADLTGVANPTSTLNGLDWSSWNQDTYRYQGETERYSLSVAENVPEPSSLSLFAFGLTSIAGALFMRRKKK
jgi:hypothetical protein